MSQEQVRKSEQTETEEAAEVPTEKLDTPAADEAADLLDEIDDALEENAQEFVAGFVQKGGE